MLWLAIGPLFIGVLVFLLIYFVAPVIVSETEIVTSVAGVTLDLSNQYFGSMPSVISSYIANLNLAMVAFTFGLITTVAIQILVIISNVFIRLARLIVSLLQKKEKEEIKDLPPIEMDPRFKGSRKGDKILGRDFDSIDRE